jgi:hypothetical protein
LASISTVQQQQQLQPSLPASDSQSALTNTNASNTASVQHSAQTNADPYAPAPNLIRVERIKDVNSGQDVFIRWVSEANTSTTHDGQQSSQTQQAYSTQPPIHAVSNYDRQFNQELPNEIERLTFDDEQLRKSLLFDDRPTSISSNYEQKRFKKREKRGKYRDLDNHPVDYEIVNGFFEDRHGKKRSVKLDRTRMNTVNDYRHTFDEVNSSAPQKDRRRKHRATSVIQPSIREVEQQQQQQYPTPPFPLPNQQLLRPYGTAFLPRGSPFYPQQAFNTTPLFSRPNFMNGVPLPRPPFWYRPMQ